MDFLLTPVKKGPQDFIFIDTSTTCTLTPQDQDKLYAFFVSCEALEVKCLLYQRAHLDLKRLYAPFSRLFVTRDNEVFMYVANYEIIPSPLKHPGN